MRELDPDERLKFNRIKGRMPYGGMIHAGELRTVDDVLTYLETLVETLGKVAVTNQSTENELFRIKANLRAVGELFRMVNE